MRVSEYFQLDKNQSELDFVDVQLETDTKLFIDPTALHLFDSEWGRECVSLIQNYFSLVLEYIGNCKDEEAKQLISVLSEPNETRMGFSGNAPCGHGMGSRLAEKMWVALKESKAVEKGIIEELEDTALLIDGIASDMISDIVTNIIREPLISYTQQMCKYYGIPMEREVAAKQVWNPGSKNWSPMFAELPVVNNRPLILVPKIIVRHSITYQADSYYNVYLLKHISEAEIAKGFVRLIKNRDARLPTKDQLREKFGKPGKEQNRKYTPLVPEALEEYREDKKSHPKQPLKQNKLADSVGSPIFNWDDLVRRLRNIAPGAQQAHEYEILIKDILTAIFYPWLSNPIAQSRIHNGRKRIDITFDNAAMDGFFHWVRENYFAPLIMIECKNYNEDPNNPELDQLAGRLGIRRGKFGILVCRLLDDEELFTQRCIDTAGDGNGYIICLDDNSLIALINEAKAMPDKKRLSLLRSKFQRLI